MILYLYALARGLTDAGVGAGMTGEPLVAIAVPQAIVAAGWLEQVPAIDPASLAAQDLVVRALHERSEALLPMRFGSHVNDVAAATRAVESVAGALQARFDLVKGREQVTLRVAGTPGAPGAPGASGAGTRYLTERARKGLPPALEPVLERLRPLVRATRIEAARFDGGVATVYHLIDRGGADDYRHTVEDAAPLTGLRLRIAGPSPAYAFAEGA